MYTYLPAVILVIQTIFNVVNQLNFSNLKMMLFENDVTELWNKVGFL